MEYAKKFFRLLYFPAAMIVMPLCFAGYMTWKEYKINNTLVKKALQGNQTAIAILGKYEKPWKLDETIVNEALQANQYALQILGIESIYKK